MPDTRNMCISSLFSHHVVLNSLKCHPDQYSCILQKLYGHGVHVMHILCTYYSSISPVSGCRWLGDAASKASARGLVYPPTHWFSCVPLAMPVVLG